MSVEKFASEFNKSSLEKLNRVTDKTIMFFDRNRLHELSIHANKGESIVIVRNEQCSDGFTNGMVLTVEDLMVDLDNGVILYIVRSPIDGYTFGLDVSEFKPIKSGDSIKTVTYQILVNDRIDKEIAPISYLPMTTVPF